LIGSHKAEPNPVKTLSAKILPDFPAGKFFLRLRVDGAESALIVDDDKNSQTFGMFIGPTVEVTTTT